MGNSYLWSFVGALLGSIITAILAPLAINLTIDKIIKKYISGPSLKDSLLSPGGNWKTLAQAIGSP